MLDTIRCRYQILSNTTNGEWKTFWVLKLKIGKVKSLVIFLSWPWELVISHQTEDTEDSHFMTASDSYKSQNKEK